MLTLTVMLNENIVLLNLYQTLWFTNLFIFVLL